MRRRLITLASCVATLCSVVEAQQSALASTSFELYHDRVYVPLTVNHEALTVVVDTGAAISAIDSRKAEEIGIHGKGSASLVGNGESKSRIAIAKDVLFTLGDRLNLLENKVAVFSLEEFASHEGRLPDGVLGVGLFRNYVVEIDYVARSLRVFAPEGYAYSGGGEVLPLRIHGDAALVPAQLAAENGAPVTVDLAIDLGTYSALRLYGPYLKQHPELTPKRTLDSFGFGLGGEFHEAEGRVPALHLGKLKLDSVTAELSEAAGGATARNNIAGTIGGEILRRFRVILDYKRGRAIFEPNGAFKEPFSGNTTGLLFTAQAPGLRTIVVSHVLANTPATEAGIEVGDVVEAVDGRSASGVTLDDLRKLACDGADHRLTLQRNGKRADASLHGRQLF